MGALKYSKIDSLHASSCSALAEQRGDEVAELSDCFAWVGMMLVSPRSICHKSLVRDFISTTLKLSVSVPAQ